MTDENPYDPPSTENLGPPLQQHIVAGNVGIGFGVSFVLGFALWALPGPLIGHNEPWDSPYPLYSMTMILGGAVIGFLVPKRYAGGFLGVWLGQVAAMIVIPWLQIAAGWIVVGAISTAVGSTLHVAGLLLGTGIHILLARRPSRRS